VEYEGVAGEGMKDGRGKEREEKREEEKKKERRERFSCP
jgi:hypothetical protein